MELVRSDAGEEDGFDPCELALTSYSRRLIVGYFLMPEERCDIARVLETVLHRARMPQPTETLLA